MSFETFARERARKRALLNRALVNSRKLTARSSHLHTIEISSPYMAGPLILPAAFEMFIYLRFNVPILSFPYARFTVSLELERIVERNQRRSSVLFLRVSSSPHRFSFFSFRSTFKANRNSVKVIQSKVIVIAVRSNNEGLISFLRIYTVRCTCYRYRYTYTITLRHGCQNDLNLFGRLPVSLREKNNA